jgi:hypothetical protein
MAKDDRPATPEEIRSALARAKEIEVHVREGIENAGPVGSGVMKFTRLKVEALIRDLRNEQGIEHGKMTRAFVVLERLMRIQRDRAARQSDRKLDDDGATLYCSFCGKNQHEVEKLIAGPTVFICNECVDLCMDILREEDPQVRAMGRALRFAPRQRKAALRALANAAQFIDRHDPAGEGAITLEAQTLLRMVVRRPDGKAEEVSGILENALTSPHGLTLKPRPLEE